MSAWDATPGALLRGRAAHTAALATLPGRDSTPRAEQYPDHAAAYRRAWNANQWAFETEGHGVQFLDNGETRATMLRLAEERDAHERVNGWCDFPDLGFPPPELRPLYAAAIAREARIGAAGPGGLDAEFERMSAEHEELIRQWDYARTQARQ